LGGTGMVANATTSAPMRIGATRNAEPRQDTNDILKAAATVTVWLMEIERLWLTPR
jgi:hypothetical protein